jgi:hypothetical protein
VRCDTPQVNEEGNQVPKTPRSRSLTGVLFVGILTVLHPATHSGQELPAGTYVGSESCRECHEDEYRSYQRYAKKASSYDSIEQMRPQLTAAEFRGCFECHTTGYGQPGGFRSEEDTPHLRNTGCESCHGPGGLHVRTAEARHIRGKLTTAVCARCHSEERVEAFRFRPLVYGGGH